MASYLVIGGSGRTGRLVVDRLTGTTNHVTIAGRRPHPDPRPAVDYIAVDLAAPAPNFVADGPDGIVVCVEPPSDAAGAEAVAHQGVRYVAQLAAHYQIRVVLVSQIYITRPAAHPEMADIIHARRRGEDALRASGAPYAIVRPGWLTDHPARGSRLEQGDTGDGQTSRHLLADTVTAAVREPAALGATFELYDEAAEPTGTWSDRFAQLQPDNHKRADAR